MSQTKLSPADIPNYPYSTETTRTHLIGSVEDVSVGDEILATLFDSPSPSSYHVTHVDRENGRLSIIRTDLPDASKIYQLEEMEYDPEGLTSHPYKWRVVDLPRYAYVGLVGADLDTITFGDLYDEFAAECRVRRRGGRLEISHPVLADMGRGNAYAETTEIADLANGFTIGPVSRRRLGPIAARRMIAETSGEFRPFEELTEDTTLGLLDREETIYWADERPGYAVDPMDAEEAVEIIRDACPIELPYVGVTKAYEYESGGVNIHFRITEHQDWREAMDDPGPTRTYEYDTRMGRKPDVDKIREELEAHADDQTDENTEDSDQ